MSVLTVVPFASWIVSVTPWAPDAEANVPWFLIATVNVTLSPAEALEGVQATGAATRSELETGLTTRASERVKELFASFCSMTLFDGSTSAPTG